MFNNRKVRVEVARKHIKKAPKFRNQLFWRHETKINVYQNDGKRSLEEKKEQFII